MTDLSCGIKNHLRSRSIKCRWAGYKSNPPYRWGIAFKVYNEGKATGRIFGARPEIQHSVLNINEEPKFRDDMCIPHYSSILCCTESISPEPDRSMLISSLRSFILNHPSQHIIPLASNHPSCCGNRSLNSTSVSVRPPIAMLCSLYQTQCSNHSNRRFVSHPVLFTNRL